MSVNSSSSRYRAQMKRHGRAGLESDERALVLFDRCEHHDATGLLIQDQAMVASEAFAVGGRLELEIRARSTGVVVVLEPNFE